MNPLVKDDFILPTVALRGLVVFPEMTLHFDIGRKKSILTLAEQIATSIVNPEEQVIFISHGDCVEEAEFLAKKIKEKVRVKDVVINMLEPVIGAHSGPGTMAVFCLGEHR